MDDKIGHPDFMGKISHTYRGLEHVRGLLSVILIFRDFRVIELSECYNSKIAKPHGYLPMG
jgi:hypothetical protein